MRGIKATFATMIGLAGALATSRMAMLGALLILAVAPDTARATVYLDLNAEEGTAGATLPNPPFCQTECSGGGSKGTFESADGAAQGAKYYQWRTVQSQPEAYTVVGNAGQNPPLVADPMGRTLYLGWYFNFTRIDGNDIWHEGYLQSADKGVEIRGPGVRWGVANGQWETVAANEEMGSGLAINEEMEEMGSGLAMKHAHHSWAERVQYHHGSCEHGQAATT